MIEWPEQLVDALARRRAIIQIGSGVSANSKNKDGQHPPTWQQFLEEGIRKCKGNCAYIRKSLKQRDYLRTCEFVKKNLGGEWIGLLRKAFLDPKYQSAAIHEAIFNIDTRIVLSTNFDRIYDSYATASAEQTFLIKDHTDDDIGMLVYGSDRYIIKMHGSIDAPNKMIFTTSDYAEARTKYPNFYRIIDSLISTNMCLLLGCGLDDPDIRILLEDYRYRNNIIPHYIVLAAPVHQAEMDLVRETRGLNVLTYSPKHNHQELTDSLFALAKRVEERRIEVANQMNW